MEAYPIDGGQRQAAGPEDFAQRLAAHPAIGDELAELSALLQARSNLNPPPVPGMEDTPLCLHAACGAREVLTAVGWLTATRRAPLRGSSCWCGRATPSPIGRSGRWCWHRPRGTGR